MGNARERLESYLSREGVPYEVQHHPRAYTAQQVAESEHVPGRSMAKVVMLVGDGGLGMAVLPAPEHVAPSKFAAAIGWGSARIAQEADFANRFADCEVGAMPAFGNLYDVPVVVDRELSLSPRIVLQAGTHTDTVAVSYADYERLAHPVVADISAGPGEARLG
ncbi:MAG TPA: YbaK/EbsC family protein [Longimicrobiales bacterium]|nr:YbaK/EbsC family protein [Longimicrobiales bacterium]